MLRGLGDMEIRLHHNDASADQLREQLLVFTQALVDRHGLLAKDETGRISYGFIHGNWALDNSRPDGRYCGVDDELTVQRRREQAGTRFGGAVFLRPPLGRSDNRVRTATERSIGQATFKIAASDRGSHSSGMLKITIREASSEAVAREIFVKAEAPGRLFPTGAERL